MSCGETIHGHLVLLGFDFFTVPTVRFQILYIFVILNHPWPRTFAGDCAGIVAKSCTLL